MEFLKKGLSDIVIRYLKIIKLVITEGYGVQATTIEVQNAFAPALYFA